LSGQLPSCEKFIPTSSLIENILSLGFSLVIDAAKNASVSSAAGAPPEKINPKPRATIGTSFQLLRIPDLSG
jgi:hypothetical protein